MCKSIDRETNWKISMRSLDHTLLLHNSPFNDIPELIRNPAIHRTSAAHSDNYTHETIAANETCRSIETS